MEKILEQILDNSTATVAILGGISTAIATVIAALKGKEVKEGATVIETSETKIQQLSEAVKENETVIETNETKIKELNQEIMRQHMQQSGCPYCGEDCNLPNIIYFKERDFTVTVPTYDDSLYGKSGKVIIDSEARLKRDVIFKLKEMGMKYETLPWDVPCPPFCNEIHIGSPVANNRTAERMLNLNKFKYCIPADSVANCPNFKIYKNIISEVIEINGLRLDFSDVGENVEIFDNSDKKLSYGIKDGSFAEAEQCGDAFVISGQTTVMITGQAEIETKTKRDDGTFVATEDVVKNEKTIKIKDNQVVTITCTAKKGWAFKIAGESLNCRPDSDYAIIIKYKMVNKNIHLLFGSDIAGTRLAVEFLLEHHNRLPEGEQYCVSIPVRFDHFVTEGGKIAVKTHTAAVFGEPALVN